MFPSHRYSPETSHRYRVNMPIDGYSDQSSRHPSGKIIRVIRYPESNAQSHMHRNRLFGAGIMAGIEIDFEETDGEVVVHVPASLRNPIHDTEVRPGTHVYSDNILFNDAGQILGWMAKQPMPLAIDEALPFSEAFVVTDYQDADSGHLYLAPGIEQFIVDTPVKTMDYTLRMLTAFGDRFTPYQTLFEQSFEQGNPHW